jgi:hypothetical protein
MLRRYRLCPIGMPRKEPGTDRRGQVFVPRNEEERISRSHAWRLLPKCTNTFEEGRRMQGELKSLFGIFPRNEYRTGRGRGGRAEAGRKGGTGIGRVPIHANIRIFVLICQGRLARSRSSPRNGIPNDQKLNRLGWGTFAWPGGAAFWRGYRTRPSSTSAASGCGWCPQTASRSLRRRRS